MIARLKGEVWEVFAGRLVVGCGGVGYEVSVPESVLAEFGVVGSTTDLWVRTIIREDDHSLYGFANQSQRHVFDLLREVKGCGARIGLAVIGTLGEDGAAAAIAAEDVRTLIKVPGIGARLAERIVVELKAKMQEIQLVRRSGTAPAPSATAPKAADELVEALIGLGYPRSRVEPVADLVRTEADRLEDQIRLALQRMAR